MEKKEKGTFSSLDPEADIFRAILSPQNKWWQLLALDKELYVEIRKDNYINVYYYGGSVAKIKYENGFVAETHQKYLGDSQPRGKNKNGRDIFRYDKIDLMKLNKDKIAKIKEHIKVDYSRHIEGEAPAEKWVQGSMITGNQRYIDSEFQYNRDSVIGRLRIDLIELSGGVLSFIELKGISDSRLRNDEERNKDTPEIIEQMSRYKQFIEKYKTEISDYYKRLIKLKQSLGLIPAGKIEFKLNMIPKLIIANTYRKMTTGREERIKAIEQLLEKHKIDYKIEKFPQ